MNTLQTLSGMTWLHLEYLQFRSLPLVIYLTDPLSQAEFVMPFLISLALSFKYLRRIQDQQIILGFLFFAMTMGVSTQGALKNEVQHLWSNGAGGGGIWAKGTIN